MLIALLSIMHYLMHTSIILINPYNRLGTIIRPDINCLREMPRLNSYANVRNIGYVAGCCLAGYHDIFGIEHESNAQGRDARDILRRDA
jgi:hypothetical protein